MSLAPLRRPGASALTSRLFAFALLATAACSGATPPSTTPTPSGELAQRLADRRVGLRAGLMNAEEVTSNMKVVAKAVSPQGFLGITNSDLAFTGNYVIQGNYNGPVVWDISNPSDPKLVVAFNCPASQNDVSVYRNLMFMSAEANNGRVDCGAGGVPEPSSANRMRGVRIFDISDLNNPRQIAAKALRACARRPSSPSACARRRTRTRTPRCSASRSSRSRSRIRRRPPS